MLDHFQRFLYSENLHPDSDAILVGVSGGVDSVVLAHLFIKTGFKIALAHVNYGKRGAESDKDEELVRNYAQQWEVPFYSNAYPKGTETPGNFQQMARNFRYQWFESLALEFSLPYIAVGHHAGDQVETFLMHEFRGAGLQGLSSMKARSKKLIRPLLTVPKEDLYRYAAKEGLTYREDASNHGSDYARNFLRNDVLPLIETRFTQVRTNVLKTISHVNRAVSLTEWLISYAGLVVSEGDSRLVALEPIKQAPDPVEVLYWIMHSASFSETQLADIWKAKPGSCIENHEYMAIREQNHIRFFPISSLPGPFEVIVNAEGNYKLPHASIRISCLPLKENAHQKVFELGYSGDQPFPIILRTKKQGEVFRPHGMQGRKKTLKKFLSDLNLDFWQRQRVVIIEMQNEVAVVAPHRSSHSFDINKYNNRVFIYWNMA